MSKGAFHRIERLVGKKGMKAIASKKVIIFGIGGVGSWCAESLIRNGIHDLTIVDSDRVSETNINRQLMATSKSVGQVKTQVLKERLLEINPKAIITSIQEVYCEENSHLFNLASYDYVIDAIDSLSHKIHLINSVSLTNAVLFCSLGASLRMDPTRIKVGDFWKVKGCPFGRIIRKRMRQRKQVPEKSFLCVYSDEVLENKGDIDQSLEQKDLELVQNDTKSNSVADQQDWNSQKAVINGTVSHITAIFGFTLAGLVTKDILEKAAEG